MGDNMVPSDVYPSDWEIPATLNDTWGWKTRDRHWKSAGYLIYRLVDVVSKGGNYLLNVGPAPDGSIPPDSADRLREVGRWLERHGEAIYGTRPSPFSVEGQPWRMTAAPGKLYVFLLRWPAGGRFRLDGLRNQVTGAFLLSDPDREPLKVERDGAASGGAAAVRRPRSAPAGAGADHRRCAPDVDPALRWDAVRPRVTLPARDGSPHGKHVRFSELDGTVSGFVETGDKLLWHLLVKQPGRYRAELEYAAGRADAGDQMQLQAHRPAAVRAHRRHRRRVPLDAARHAGGEGGRAGGDAPVADRAEAVDGGAGAHRAPVAGALRFPRNFPRSRRGKTAATSPPEFPPKPALRGRGDTGCQGYTR